MIPSSSIQVLQQDLDTLIVLDPPYYLVGGLTVFLTLGVARRFWSVLKGRDIWESGFGLVCLVLAVPFIVGIGLLTSKTVIHFSSSSEVVSIDKYRMGIHFQPTVIPLESISRASVDTGPRSRALTLVLRKGELVRLSGFTTQGGQSEAANAINNFLQRLRK